MKTTSRKTGHRNQIRSAAERSRLIKLYKSSGLKPSEFCREHGIHLSTFCGWLSRTQSSPEKKTPRKKQFCFVEAKVAAASDLPTGMAVGLEVVLHTGTVLRFRDAVCVSSCGDWLKEVLSC